MDSIGSAFKALADLIVMIWQIHFTVFGYDVTIGAVFCFCALAGLLLKFLDGLSG